jgi:hypothetical protein
MVCMRLTKKAYTPPKSAGKTLFEAGALAWALSGPGASKASQCLWLANPFIVAAAASAGAHSGSHIPEY